MILVTKMPVLFYPGGGPVWCVIGHLLERRKIDSQNNASTPSVNTRVTAVVTSSALAVR